MSSISCSIGPHLECVNLQCEGKPITAQIDAGSSDCCINLAGLSALGENCNNLLLPTEAMCQIYNAVGGVMEPVG